MEILAIFALFFAQGWWPAPNVNEPYYLGKALHFWNPQWARGDFFLDTGDAHWVFYWTVGWLALCLSLPGMAWTLRVLTWLGMACGWQRLSRAVAPRPGFAVLSAGLLVLLNARLQMAGEWFIGGAEGKGFAYVLLFFALEQLVRGQWKAVWPLLGAASAFHVLVGGWATVAAAAAWLCVGRREAPLRGMLPYLAAGGLLALPGLLPVLRLNRGITAGQAAEAARIYVFERLPHHLDVVWMWDETPEKVLGFAALCLAGIVLWVLAWRLGRGNTSMEAKADTVRPIVRLGAWVGAVVAVALAGVAVSLLQFWDADLAAALLRYYWFRLSDVAVPLGVALLIGWLVVQFGRRWPRVGATLGTLAVLAVAAHLGLSLASRADDIVKQIDQGSHHRAWRATCDFIAHAPDIPRDARFLTLYDSYTFKWYTGRPEVFNWKEVPQDVRGLIAWRQRMIELYYKDAPGDPELYFCLAERGAEQVQRLAEEYQADYVLTLFYPEMPQLDRIYHNESYAVYRIHRGARPAPAMPGAKP